MLWIALHLPLLSLESFAATLTGEQAQSPLALVDAHHIATVNAEAQALGVEPGQKRATALALAPDLLIGQADAARDAAALTAIAHAALAFTPSVCVQPSHDPSRGADTVLLEVRASLRYFGGHARLLGARPGLRLGGDTQPVLTQIDARIKTPEMQIGGNDFMLKGQRSLD